jgi:hypothetical protein
MDWHMAHNTSVNPDKVGWRVSEWAADVGISRAFAYEMIAEKTIRSVKVGAARIITTPPADYLRSLGETEL